MVRRGRKEIDDGVLREGTYGMVPVMPRLTVRELARLDAYGPVAGEGLVSRLPKRRLRPAEREALKQRARWDRDGLTPELDDEDVKEEDLPTVNPLARKPSYYAPALPWHEASVTQSGLLDPFVVGGYPQLDGPIVGVSNHTGALWRYDAWSPRDAGASTSVNAWIVGLMGSGKSLMLKTWATRETTMPWGRKVIVEGDPNKEWAPIARKIGGQVIEVGGGQYLNPLDPGPCPPSRNADEWRNDVLGIQQQAMESMAAVLAPRSVFSLEARSVMSACLRSYADRGETPTIASFVDMMQSDWPDSTPINGVSNEAARDAANWLILVFDQMVTGPASGAFERESTIEIATDSPMTVFNTGSVEDKNDQKKELYMAAMNATVERLCNQHDSAYRIVIAEEGHQVLKNPVLVEAWEKRMRESRHIGVSNWMLLHELSDLDKFAQEGSAERNKINSVLTLATTQVIYAQSASSLAIMERLLPDLTGDELSIINSLPRYAALWRVGSHVRDEVTAVLSPDAFKLYQTDKPRTE